jgi:hypothetical protein
MAKLRDADPPPRLFPKTPACPTTVYGSISRYEYLATAGVGPLYGMVLMAMLMQLSNGSGSGRAIENIL